MRCPTCRAGDTRVLASRLAEGDGAVRRRRECVDCGERFTTFERAEEAPLWVVKRDGRREPFERRKLLAGLARACAKRPVPLERVEVVASAVEAQLRAAAGSEVASERIGELALGELRGLDGVAYVRFASVYRRFEDVDEFQRELELLDTSPLRTYVR